MPTSYLKLYFMNFKLKFHFKGKLPNSTEAVLNIFLRFVKIYVKIYIP